MASSSTVGRFASLSILILSIFVFIAVSGCGSEGANGAHASDDASASNTKPDVTARLLVFGESRTGSIPISQWYDRNSVGFSINMHADRIDIETAGRSFIDRDGSVQGSVYFKLMHHVDKSTQKWADAKVLDETVTMKELWLGEATARDLLGGLELIAKGRPPAFEGTSGSIYHVDAVGEEIHLTRNATSTTLKFYYLHTKEVGGGTTNTNWHHIYVTIPDTGEIIRVLREGIADMDRLKKMTQGKHF